MAEESAAPQGATFMVAKLGDKRLRLVDMPAGTVAEIAREHDEVLRIVSLREDLPTWKIVVDRPLSFDMGVAISVLTAAANILGEPLPNPFTVDAVQACFDIEPGDLPPLPDPPPDDGGEEAPDPTSGGTTSTAG